MDGSEFFEPESMYAVSVKSFPITYFLSVAFSESMCIIIKFLIWVLFPQVLDEGLPLEFEWQHVTLSIQDSSQSSGWS